MHVSSNRDERSLALRARSSRSSRGRADDANGALDQDDVCCTRHESSASLQSVMSSSGSTLLTLLTATRMTATVGECVCALCE